MSSLPAKMKKIKSKMKMLVWPQDISNCKIMGFFSDSKGCSLSDLAEIITLSRLYRCPRYLQEGRSDKKRGAKVATRLYLDFSDVQGQRTPAGCCAVWRP